MYRRNVALGLAAAYAALSVLVARGALSGADQWAVDHLMPGRPGTGPVPSAAEGLVPFLHAIWRNTLDVVANVVTLPAQALISTVLVGLACVALERRGRRRAALAWGAVWIVGLAVEVLCKSVIARPLLHVDHRALVGLESSYPSGHALRSVLLVAVVAAVWPAARRWVGLWAAATLVLLEIDGIHAPSDIVGGLLLALLLILVGRTVARKSG